MLETPDDSRAPTGARRGTWVFTIDEACQATKLSRNRIYDEINAGRLRIIKSGRRTLVSEWALEDWLRGLERESRVDSAAVSIATAASVKKRFGREAA